MERAQTGCAPRQTGVTSRFNKHDSQSYPMHPKELSIQDFLYDLPNERIARYPLAARDASKLLIWKQQQITASHYRDLAEHLPGGSLLVFNNTRVVEARLLFQKPTGGVIEIFCLEPSGIYPDISTAMATCGSVEWKCLVGGASKWKKGQVLEKMITHEGSSLKLEARCTGKGSGHFIITFNWEPSSLSFAALLHAAGAIPLPPYLKREAETSDAERYQTIFAREEGSVAAPTAGLHFTENILNGLAAKDIRTAELTLHVGAGTFKPVQADKMEDHDMHAEWIDVSRTTLLQLRDQLPGMIIPVGTTSLRTIESLFWMGVKLLNGKKEDAFRLHQWEAYDHADTAFTASDALNVLIQYLDEHQRDRIIARTQIIIAPGYRFRLANALITNFHQPASTLLLLVAAITGTAWRDIYAYALANDFRFLSYGDGSLLWMQEGSGTTEG